MPLLLWIVALLASISLHVSAEPVGLRYWFGGFQEYFENKTQGICRHEYELYLARSTCLSCLVPSEFPGPTRSSIAIVNCLLDHTEEFIKANLAVGTVILGLLPTVLSFSGSTTTEIGLLALRRPLLATLLATSSPSIYPIRAFDFDEPVAPLRTEGLPFEFAANPSLTVGRLVSVLQYIFALAATANVATQIWALCVNSVSVLDLDLPFLPLFWPLTTLVMHLLGVIYVSYRIQLVSKATTLKQRALMEFSLCASHVPYSATVRPQTWIPVILSWLASVLTICHIIYGTAVLSSLIFVPAVNAIYIGLRLWASALVARTVVMYELSGMGHSMTTQE